MELLRSTGIGSKDDWRVIAVMDNSREETGRLEENWYGFPVYPYSCVLEPRDRRRPADQAREILEIELNYWLSYRFSAKSDLVIAWNPKSGPDGGWELRIEFQGYLFKALALQLALAVSRSRALYTCSGCGMPYIRTKDAPRSGRANFCDRCGREEALRQADRRRRERMTEARRLCAEGMSVPEIATRLKVRKVATIRRWVKRGK